MSTLFFQNIDNLPKELIFIVYDYIPSVAMIFNFGNSFEGKVAMRFFSSKNKKLARQY